MSQQERPIIDRVWEFTKDISVKVSKQAEKHWKINTLRVEIASIKHKKSNCCKELGKFVYESLKSNSVEEDSYKTSLEGFYVELQNLDNEIMEREKRIEVLASEPEPEEPPAESTDEVPPVPEADDTSEEAPIQAEVVEEEKEPEKKEGSDA